jgi:hypothetical protein
MSYQYINILIFIKDMKAKFIIIAIIIASIFTGGCNTKDTVEAQLTLVPTSIGASVSANTMNIAAEVISKRLAGSFGIPESSMKTEVSENQISLTVLKIEAAKLASIKKVITDYSRLEFWETFENSELIGSLSEVNNYLRDLKPLPDVSDMDERSSFTAKNPLFGILIPRVDDKGQPLRSCMIGLAVFKDTATVNSYLKMQDIKSLFPPDIKFMWSKNPYKYDKSQTLYELHTLKISRSDGKAPLDGSAIISANPVKGKSESDIKIQLSMNAEGTTRWAEITGQNIGRCIAVAIDGSVRSYPVVQNEIQGGKTEITGDFTFEEVKELSAILNSGKLPFELKVATEQIIR